MGRKNKANAVQLKKREKFLTLLREIGLIKEAAQLTKIGRNLPYSWARQSETFAKQFAEAKSEGHEVLADHLEQCLTTRATEGVVDAIYYQGKKIGERRLYSDTAAIVMLKSLRPGRFVEQMIGIGVSGQQVVVNVRTFAAFQPVPAGTAPQPTVTDTAALSHNPAPLQEE